jgi:hypothetical protein
METASKEIQQAVESICKRHDPAGCLPVVLGLATGAIVAGVSAHSLRWHFALLASLAGAVLMFVVLMWFRVGSWSRQHPLLARIYKLSYLRTRGHDDEDDLLELGKAIVARYLPEDESKPLLERIDDAMERTAALVGLDSEDEPVRGRPA